MAVYLVNWKTFAVNGSYTEGSFNTERPAPKDAAEAADMHKDLIEVAKDSLKEKGNSYGTGMFISGIFKL